MKFLWQLRKRSKHKFVSVRGYYLRFRVTVQIKNVCLMFLTYSSFCFESLSVSDSKNPFSL